MKPRVTIQAVKVMQAIAKAEPVAGSDIHRMTGVLTGTLYPLLDRFTHAKWLSRREERGDPKKLGRPLRRFYRLTAAGRAKLGEIETALGVGQRRS